MYFILLILLAAPLLAQDVAPGPVPTPEVSPSPSTDATPPAGPSPTAAAAASPEAAPEASPAASPVASPAADEDMIPLPPESGAAESPIVSESEVAPVLRPGPGESLPDSAFADPNAVIPDEPGAGGAPSGPSGPSAGELERKLKIRYREVRTEMEKDPAVRSLWDQAQAATSFEDERAALREFYRLLFKKMRKVDKDLTARCDAMERAYINRLAQTRQEPTIPLNPPPTPEPLGN